MSNTSEQKLDEILEIVRFIKDNGATQESVDDLDKKVDGLDKRMDGLENELSGVRSELQSVKDEILLQIKRLEDKTQSDNDALARDYVKLVRRVEVLENQFKRLQVA